MEDNKFHLAIVTGASSGIGETLAHLLAEKGINLILVARDLNRLNTLAESLREKKIDVQTISADLSKPEGREIVIKQIKTQTPDLVINNAGIGLYGEALSYQTADQMKVLEVNGLAVLELTLDAARAMISAGKKGTIMNVSSVAGFYIFPGFAVYAASKTFVTQLSQSLDEEFKSYHVRVLAACPGVVETNFQKRAGGKKELSMEGSMTPAFAAQEIWNQIVGERTVRIFDWKYRLVTFLANYIIPTFFVKKILKANIDKRRSSHPIIKN